MGADSNPRRVQARVCAVGEPRGGQTPPARATRTPGSTRTAYNPLMHRHLQRWRVWHLALAVIVLGFGLRAYRLDNKNLWYDEGFSVFMARQPLTELPEETALDVHPKKRRSTSIRLPISPCFTAGAPWRAKAPTPCASRRRWPAC